MFVKISEYLETLKFFKIFNPCSLPLYWNKKSFKTGSRFTVAKNSYFHNLPFRIRFSSLCGFHQNLITALKLSKYRVFSGPYFPVFSSNTGKQGTENYVFGHFSCRWLASHSFWWLYGLSAIILNRHFEMSSKPSLLIRTKSFSVNIWAKVTQNTITTQNVFLLRISSTNVTKSAVSGDLVTFAEEVLSGKLLFLQELTLI